jgi:hypothetical protein
MRRPDTDVEEKDSPCDRWSRSARRQPYKVIRVRLDIGRDREAGVQRELLELSLLLRRRILLLNKIEPAARAAMLLGSASAGRSIAVNGPARQVLPFDHAMEDRLFVVTSVAGSG